MGKDALKGKIMDVLNKHKTGKELVWGKIDSGLVPPVPTNALFIKCFNDVEIPLFKEAILELESEGRIVMPLVKQAFFKLELALC